MKDHYPYTIIPQKVEKIRQEGIPVPKLPKLLPLPEKVKRKYLGSIIFVLALSTFIAFNIISSKAYSIWWSLSFLVSLISLVAMIFEFVQYGKLKKQYEHDLKLYNEHKEAYKKIKSKEEKIIAENKNEKLVKKYQQDKIDEFFKTSYDIINAAHNEYSPAKKRFKLFLEEYFPDEILDNVKVVHETKKIDYIPDFVIQFVKPKLNVAIEIEEPYSLSDIPENIQKDFEAKDRLRQRFSNELGWIVIVISEEQSVVSPTECCKFIEDSIEVIFGEIKDGKLFTNIEPIKKQKMLTGEERAHLKKIKYREKYLIEAGLMDGPIGYPLKEKTEIEGNIKEHISEINGNGKVEKELINNTNSEKLIPELNNTMSEMKTPLEKKKEIENEQMMLIKKIAEKVKTASEETEVKKEEEKELIKHTTETKSYENEEVVSQKGKQLKREEDILKDLYTALDKHSQKQKERNENVEEKLSDSDEEKKIEEKEEKVVEHVVKEEKKEISAAEMILAKKRQMEKAMSVSSTDSDKEKEEVVIEEEKSKNTTEIKEEIKKEEIKEKEDVKEMEESTTLQNNTERKKDESEETIKKQELIDSYREKIEGAVFDKQWDELIQLCDEAIKEIPYWDWAYYRRSTAWGNKREFTRVILDCNKAIGFNPTLADAYYNRGTARFFLGKYMEASDDYQKSIELNYYKKADAYFNKGLCYQKLDQQKKAYAEFLKAKEMGSQKAIDILKSYSA